MGRREDIRKARKRYKAAATLLSEKKRKQYLKAVENGEEPHDAAWRLSIPSDAMLGMEIERREKQKSLKQQWKEQAKALPRETRVAFMREFHAGKSLEDARIKAGITLDEAVGTLLLNTKRKTIEYLVPLEETV